MRTLLLAVFLLGCGGGTETVGTTSQAMPGPTPVPELPYSCQCSDTGRYTADLICMRGTWSCIASDASESGWEAKCSGSLSDGSASDLTGEPCGGTMYGNFPDRCPNLDNFVTSGTYWCVGRSVE